MPTIPLPSELGGFLVGTLELHIDAFMFFPDNGEKRQAYILAGHSGYLAKLEPFRDVATGGADDLLELAYKHRFEYGFKSSGGFKGVECLVKNHDVHDPYQACLKAGGLVASSVLLFVLLNAETGNLGQATINKGIERFQSFLAMPENKHYPMPRERSGLVKMWSRFKSVAHFWAAEHLTDTEHKKGGEVASLGRFLAVAEELRRRGENHVSKHVKRPILSPGEAWKLPDWLDLPNVELELRKVLLPCKPSNEDSQSEPASH